MKCNYFGNNKNANALRVTDILYADNVPCRESGERYSSSKLVWITKEKEAKKKYKNVMPIKHKNLERASTQSNRAKGDRRDQKAGQSKKKNKTNVERGRRKKINIWNHSSISACQKNVVKTSHFNLCFIITFCVVVVLFFVGWLRPASMRSEN